MSAGYGLSVRWSLEHASRAVVAIVEGPEGFREGVGPGG